MTWLTGWHWLLMALAFFALDFFWRRGVSTGVWIACLVVAFVYSLFDLPFTVQAWIFLISCVAGYAGYWFLYRAASPQNATGKTKKHLQKMLGARASLLQDVHKGHAKIQLNDILWDVRSDQPLKKGQLVEVVGYSGGSLEVAVIKLANPAEANHN